MNASIRNLLRLHKSTPTEYSSQCSEKIRNALDKQSEAVKKLENGTESALNKLTEEVSLD